MKPDSDSDEFVDALRADLPSHEQEARLRARLAAIGVAGVTTLSTSAAAAAAKGVAGSGMVARIGALSWGAKLGLAGAVCAAAAAGPLVASRSVATRSPAGIAPASTQPGERRPSSATARSASAPARLGEARPDARLIEAPDARADQPSPSRAPAAEPLRRSAQLDRRAPSLATAAPQSAAATPVTEPPRGPTPTAAFAGEAAAVPRRSAAESPETTLREETRLIDEALASLRDGDLSRARELVREHERRFPNGLLRRERERARTKLAEQSASDKSLEREPLK